MVSERKIKKLKVLNLCLAVVALFILLHVVFDNRMVIQADIFTEEEVEILKGIQGDVITLGYFPGQEINFIDSLHTFLEVDLGIELQLVEYADYETLQAAAIQGEVDLINGMFMTDKSEELNWISFSMTGYQRVITHQDHPLMSAVNLEGSHVGLLRGSQIYFNFQESKDEDYFKMTFYDTMEEALDAVENQEIDAFLTRSEQASIELIHRDQLQIEFAFQSRIINVEFATNHVDIFEVLVDIEKSLVSTNFNLFIENLRHIHMQNKELQIQSYIQEKYSQLISEIDFIEVGLHPVNFPYSFFEENGDVAGVYGEMLNLFSLSTGIPFYVRNCRHETMLDNLFDDLIANDIQFLLGFGEERQSSNITKIGMHEVQDNIISMEKYSNQTEMANLSELTYGILTTHELASLILNQKKTVLFNDYEEAVAALVDEKIDVLIGHESVLTYYRDIAGITSLSQTNHINRLSSYGIIGNTQNEELNTLMADIQRLYPLLYEYNLDVRWGNHKVNYLEKYTLLRKQQQTVIFLVTIVGVCLGALWIVKRERETRNLRKMAERDSLTMLYNKATYEKKCKELIQAYPETLGIFIFIDLDNFKQINDDYGHAVGDEMLIKFSEQLKNVSKLNPKTICFRISGDEFGIFSMGYHSRCEIIQLIQNIEAQIKVEVRGDAATMIGIKYSAGGSIFNVDTSCFSNLKKYADFAMYQAKKKKDNIESHIELFRMDLLVQHYKESLSQDAVEFVLSNREICTVYQPIVILNDNGIYGYEGLSRYRYLKMGNIANLIEQAEVVGRLEELDLLMMEKVILGFTGSGKLFINMLSKSPEAVLNFINHMIHLAKNVDLPIEDIVIELSERAKWSKESIKVIKDCKNKYHFMIALDDFGVGVSGNELLLEVSPDIVKIDRYFIEKIYEDKRKYSLVKSIIEFIKSSGMKVACEGVELKNELDILVELGSDLGQGYYLGKPK